MENRKGSGIFLGVVSVATLIVAIIGATFAYFSATVSSNNDAIDVTAYKFDMSIVVEKVVPTEATTGIIPLSPNAAVTNTSTNQTKLIYALNEAENRCIDDNGRQVCALYKATLTNNGDNDETLNMSFITTKNEAATGGEVFTDLTVQMLNYDDTAETNKYTASTIAAITLEDGTAATENTVSVSGYSVTVANGESKDVYFVVYLNDDGTDQSLQMGASYWGQVTFESSVGNQISGAFSVGQ